MAGDAHTQRPGRSSLVFRQTLLRVVSACVIGAIFALVVPRIFGEEYATRKVARVVAPFVGAFYEPKAPADKITVLLIDDEALKMADESWPPSYDYYAKILNDVAYYKPSAVFVDLIFSSAREDPSMGSLCKVLDEMKRSNIQVFLAATLDEQGRLSLRPELQGKATEVAVEYMPDDLDRVVWTYPMAGFDRSPEAGKNAEEHQDEGKRDPKCKEEPARDVAPPVRSAALAIYEDVIYKKKVDDPTEPLALTWGLVPVHDGLRWTELNAHGKRDAADKLHVPGTDDFDENYDLYCNESENRLTLIGAAVSHALVPKHGKPVCVFHHTLYQREMLYPNKAQSSRLSKLLAGRVVMIGSAFSYSNDIVFSPIQGRIPGVYLHAMALDNLITDGPDYTKQVELSELKADGEHGRALLLLFFGLLLVLLFTLGKERTIEARKEHRKRARATAGRIEVDETLLATTHDPDANASDPKAEISMVVHVHTETMRRPRRTLTKRVLGKLTEAAGRSALKVAEIALSFLLVAILLYLAQQRWLNVPYLTAVEVTLFALVSEWLEWNKKFVDWLSAPEEE
jgi:hypothetical protein